MAVVTMEQLYDERQVVLQATVPASTAVIVEDSWWQAGKITQVMFDFPPGCIGLVRARLLKDRRPFYPVHEQFLALNQATPVYPMANQPYYVREPLGLEIQNRDGGNPHTITCTVCIRIPVKG